MVFEPRTDLLAKDWIAEHTEGIDEWAWTSKSRRDMEELANAIAALSMRSFTDGAEPAPEGSDAQEI